MTKIRRLLTTLLVSTSILLPGLFSLAATPAYATSSALNDLCTGINSTSAPTGGSSSCTGSNTSISSIASTIVNVFTYIVGIISVLMLIIAGFRYVTSGGESSKVSSAKNTLIYAIVGIVIVIAAQVIVSFVANKAGGAIQ